MQFTTFNEEVAEQLKRAAETTGGLAGYLGFRHTEFTAGRLIAEMDARDDLKTPFGNLHGGAAYRPWSTTASAWCFFIR